MVISFSVKEARDQLLEKGVVYTFRWKRRKKTGKDWANSGRRTKKIADVIIEEIGEMEPTVPLIKYSFQSGFKTVWDWQCVISDMPQPHYGRGWLYKVTLKEASN